jgi:dephospho-CoA kinase
MFITQVLRKTAIFSQKIGEDRPKYVVTVTVTTGLRHQRLQERGSPRGVGRTQGLDRQ